MEDKTMLQNLENIGKEDPVKQAPTDPIVTHDVPPDKYYHSCYHYYCDGPKSGWRLNAQSTDDVITATLPCEVLPRLIPLVPKIIYKNISWYYRGTNAQYLCPFHYKFGPPLVVVLCKYRYYHSSRRGCTRYVKPDLEGCCQYNS